MSESRHTFTIPPGFEAVRDHEGRATGEIRPVGPATAPQGELVEALRECQSALAMMINPESIVKTPIRIAWAACVAAESRARAALPNTTGEAE